MFRKALVCVCCVAVLLAAAYGFLLHKGSDCLTFIQRRELNGYLASGLSRSGGDMMTPDVRVAVACGTDGYEPGSFLGARNQADYKTGSVHLKVSADAEKQPVLSGGFADIGEESVSLLRAFEELEKSKVYFLVLELSEYTALPYIDAFLVNTGYTEKTVITGVYQSALATVREQMPHCTILCDYSDENILTLEQIAQLGADGIICSGKALNADVFTQAEQLGLIVWADCSDDVYSTVKALWLDPQGLVTKLPYLADGLRSGWHEENFELFVKEK